MDGTLTLRAFDEDDLGFLDRLCTDPAALGPFEWFGFGDVRVRRRRWEQDGFVGAESTALAVVLADGTVAGIASWKAANRGGPPGVCYEIGLALLPEHRGPAGAHSRVSTALPVTLRSYRSRISGSASASGACA